jgi:hypothetical protein
LTYGELRSALPTSEDWADLADLAVKMFAWPDRKKAALSGSALRDYLTGIRVANHRVKRIERLAIVAAQALAARMAEGGEYPDDAPCPLITAVNATADGTGLLLSWRKPVDCLRSNVPTLILDATADLELLRQWRPDVELITNARATLPAAVEVNQVQDSLCPYRGWVPKTERPNAGMNSVDEQRRWNNVKHLVHLLDVACADARGGQVGFIGPKPLVRAIESLWNERRVGRPPNILIGTFGAIAGLDYMKDVGTLIVWCRMSPSVGAVEALARAAFCAPIAPLGGPFLPGKQRYLMADGSSVRADVSEWHPDPNAEAMRAQIVDAELYQAVGRARPFRRTAQNPLKIIIGTSQPTRLPVTRLTTVDELLWAGPIEALAARGVVVPTGPGNKGCSQILAAATGMSVDAVKSHIKRLKVSRPHKRILMGVCHSEDRLTPDGHVAFRLMLPERGRYFTTVFLREDLAADPEAAFRAEGIVPAVLERVATSLTPKALAPAPAAERLFVLELFRRHAAALANGIVLESANDLHELAEGIEGRKAIDDASFYMLVLIGQYEVRFGGQAA